MNKIKKQIPLIRLRFKGSAIHDGRILLNDLLTFVNNFNLAIERTINVTLTGSSFRIGRTPKDLEIASALEIVSTSRHSFGVALDLRRDEKRAFPIFDLGYNALDKLIDGLPLLNPNIDRLPEGYDQGVLAALRDAGSILDRGIDQIYINGRRNSHAVRIKYDSITRHNIIASIKKIEQSLTTIEGRLLMVDLKEDSLRCRLYPSSGYPIQCSFNESLVPQIINNLRHFVKATGQAQYDPITKRVHQLNIFDLEPLERILEPSLVLPVSAFWESKDFEELAEEQGIEPINNLDTILGGFPEDADFESFLKAIRSSRDN